MAPIAAVHPATIVESLVLGPGTAVGAHSRVGRDVEIGGPCAIGEQTLLEGAIHIAAGVEIGSHTCLRGPLEIEAAVSIGAKCCVDAGTGGAIVLGEAAVIGAGATVWPGVTVGKRARVEPGSVVTNDVPAMAVVAGNPAQIVRYSGVPSAPPCAHPAAGAEITETPIRGVTLRRLPLHEDLRGRLTFGEAQRHLPFPIQRYFLSFAVSSEQVRGEHGHRTLRQFLTCVHGRVHIVADDGANQADFRDRHSHSADDLERAIRFSADAVLLALCSANYNPADYIRDYAEFLRLVRRKAE